MTHCNTLQHTATHCNTLQHTRCKTCTYYRLLQGFFAKKAYNFIFPTNRSHPISACTCSLPHCAWGNEIWGGYDTVHCNTLQHSATLCNTHVAYDTVRWRDTGWLPFVDTSKLHVSFAKYYLSNRARLQKRPIIVRPTSRRHHIECIAE